MQMEVIMRENPKALHEECFRYTSTSANPALIIGYQRVVPGQNICY